MIVAPHRNMLFCGIALALFAPLVAQSQEADEPAQTATQDTASTPINELETCLLYTSRCV